MKHPDRGGEKVVVRRNKDILRKRPTEGRRLGPYLRIRDCESSASGGRPVHSEGVTRRHAKDTKDLRDGRYTRWEGGGCGSLLALEVSINQKQRLGLQEKVIPPKPEGSRKHYRSQKEVIQNGPRAGESSREISTLW